MSVKQLTSTLNLDVQCYVKAFSACEKVLTVLLSFVNGSSLMTR